ncbi:MAG: type II toxin-antitoxin system HipA family toxin, partial [Alphaproteobacteria bacterium]
MTTHIAVYADWDGLSKPFRLGLLRGRLAGAREVFDFSFDRVAVDASVLGGVSLDPRIGFYEGPQYPPRDTDTFGVFADASPDRWGRLLMRRRFEREQRAGRHKRARLNESDYLLGVHDTYRVGALRFRRDDTGPFLDNHHDLAAPPFVQLRELEAASLALEQDEENMDQQGDRWLRMLIAPGGSLGGARPKASVADPAGDLWIAKFPSAHDTHDIGGWEFVTQTLARAAGLRVPEGLARKFNSSHHTFMVQRFDRTASGRRLHFASAMTLTGHRDGDDGSTGVSYLELARVLIEKGAQPRADLLELWSRIVFNVLVSNADDHLRNHGFMLIPNAGWKLADAYDVNPVPGAEGLKLNISEVDNARDLDLVRSVAPYFRVSTRAAREVIVRIK